ncbi:MAG TPA: methionine--tRNA ligase [Candidatus Acidoferrales bacterium]|nr:methionine--tRNA ligase [Candidatus Acidoferrales bacterium]
MAEKPKYYLTTPIYYTNGLPHIGHTYSTIVCDTIRRYKRMRGYDVVMTTGTDEHGVNVERSAKKAGMPESEFVAKMAAEWRRLWDELGIQGDEFIRTTEIKHAHTVQWLFRQCKENGYIYPGHYTGQYCIYDNAYVDVKPGESCPDCGRPTETVTEENYYFKLSAFEKPLLDFYKKNPNFIQPEARKNEILSFVEGGLKDLSITRTSIRWGIPVPGEESHVFYVWFDALTAYLSAVGGPNYEQRGYWPADLHLVGKEIIRFHAVYWPAFLMAAMLPLPKQIWAHGWLLMESSKMSKSKGNVVKPLPIVNVLGMDALRYFLLREVVFGQDGNFSYDALVTRYNSDLANGIGNLASRTAALIEKNFGGKVAKPAGLQPQDEALAKTVQAAIGEVLEGYENLAFSKALEQLWSVIAAADKYLTAEQPWALGDSEAEKQRKATVLWTVAELLRVVTVLAHPVLPESTGKVWALLGQRGAVGAVEFDGLRWGQLAPGTALGKSQALFPRIEKAEALERMEAMENEAQNAPSPTAPSTSAAGPSGTGAAAAPAAAEKIGIEDFTKVEMRVGQIKTAERIVGADKLLKLTVDIGTEIRQICAGIAQYYEPEKLIGRKVAVVVNLAPRKLRGVESNGMIVAASVGPEGRPVLAGFPDEDVEIGARLK